MLIRIERYGELLRADYLAPIKYTVYKGNELFGNINELKETE